MIDTTISKHSNILYKFANNKDLTFQQSPLSTYPSFYWSTSYLIEQIYIELISAKEDDGITLKYEKRAKWLSRRIPLFDTSLPFIVYKKDLSKSVKKELCQIGETDYEYMKSLVKNAIEMIFMGLDEEL